MPPKTREERQRLEYFDQVYADVLYSKGCSTVRSAPLSLRLEVALMFIWDGEQVAIAMERGDDPALAALKLKAIFQIRLDTNARCRVFLYDMIAAASPKPKRKTSKKKTSKRKKATAPPWSHEGFGQHVKPQQSYFDDEVEGYGDFPPQTKEPYWWQGRAGSEWRGIDDKPKTRSRSRSRKKDKVEMAADALSLGSQISSALKKK